MSDSELEPVDIASTSPRGHPAWRAARRLVVSVIGGSVLLVGVSFLVLPGPAFFVIPLGLGILATEFVWARRLLERVKSQIQRFGGSDATPVPTSDLSHKNLVPGEGPLPVLLLAGQRGGEDAFLRATGAPHRALVPLANRPLLFHVIDALRASAQISEIRVVMDGEGETLARDAIQRDAMPAPDRFVRGEASPSQSVLAALDGDLETPFLVTTADHALLSPTMIADFLAGARHLDADLVAGVVPIETVRARYPASKRTVLRFRDGGLCGANLFLLRRRDARRIVAFWVDAEAYRKKPWRLLRQFGLWTAIRFALGRLTLRDALARAESRLGLRLAAHTLTHAEAAIDVDGVADLELAEQILAARR